MSVSDRFRLGQIWSVSVRLSVNRIFEPITNENTNNFLNEFAKTLKGVCIVTGKPNKNSERPNNSTAEEVSGEEIPILVQYVVLPDEDLATRQYPLAF